MSRFWGFIVVILVIAFFSGMSIEAAFDLLGNAFMGVVRGIVAFFRAVSDNGEAVG